MVYIEPSRLSKWINFVHLEELGMVRRCWTRRGLQDVWNVDDGVYSSWGNPAPLDLYEVQWEVENSIGYREAAEDDGSLLIFGGSDIKEGAHTRLW